MQYCDFAEKNKKIFSRKSQKGLQKGGLKRGKLDGEAQLVVENWLDA